MYFAAVHVVGAATGFMFHLAPERRRGNYDVLG